MQETVAGLKDTENTAPDLNDLQFSWADKTKPHEILVRNIIWGYTKVFKWFQL